MSTLIHADIFFFVTTVCVVLLTVLLTILFIYIFRIAGNIRRLTDRARIEGDFFMDEFHDLAERMHTRRFGIGAIFRIFRRIARRYYY